MPQPPRTKPAWLFKHKVAGMAPCSEGFSADVAGVAQSQKEDPQHVANTCSLKEGQTLADLVLTNVASPLHHVTKTNLKLVQVDVGTLDCRLATSSSQCGISKSTGRCCKPGHHEQRWFWSCFVSGSALQCERPWREQSRSLLHCPRRCGWGSRDYSLPPRISQPVDKSRNSRRR